MMSDTKDKQYFTVKDLLEAAIKLARNDPQFAEAEKTCPLDYEKLRDAVKYDKLYYCSFDVIGNVVYGTNEGIYGDIFLDGNWSKGSKENPWRNRICAYSLKTLERSKDAYMGMNTIVALISFYANEFIGTHMDRFD